MKHFTSIPVLALSGLLSCCFSQAQTQELRLERIIEEAPLNDGELPSPLRLQRQIVEECEAGNPLVIQIPGYNSESAGRGFGMANFFDSGGGGGGTVPIDENGTIHSSRRCIIDTAGNLMVTQHYFVFSQNRETGEYRYYLDLSDVPLMAFARHFASTYRALPQGSPPSRRRLGLTLEATDAFAEDVVIPSLQGEGITFEQALDLLRRESGCDVIQADGKLIIDWCG